MGSGGGGGGRGGGRVKGGGGGGQALTPQDIEALKRYTGQDYAGLNAQLNQGDINNFSDLVELDANLTAALDKLPNHKGETFRVINFRSERNKNAFLDGHDVGNIVKYKAYTSTSATQVGYDFNAKRGADHARLFIKGKTGKNVSKHSSHPGEAEVLFKRGTRFRITRRTGNANGGIDLHVTEV